jgi:hypothetical protein
MADKENNTSASDFINNTEKILNMLDKFDEKLDSLDSNLLELKWELDNIKNSIAPKTPKPAQVKSTHSVVTSTTKK